MRVLSILAFALASALIPTAPSFAENSPSPQLKAEVQAAWAAAARTAVAGPSQIKLSDEATLQIGPDEVFVPAVLSAAVGKFLACVLRR